MARSPLDVWLYDTVVGHLTEPKRGQLRLDFTDDAETRFRPGSAILSTSMPVNTARRPNGIAVRAFFHGLLPEGTNRRTLEAELGVAAGDDFGLLTALGRDCAGAVVLLPAGSPAPTAVWDPTAVDQAWVDDAVAHIDERPLGVDTAVRVSLAGAQQKLLLVRHPDGGWARPTNGTPSTHILKPQDMRFPAYAAAEVFCLALARRQGLSDVDAWEEHFGSRPVAVVARYDRRSGPDGTVTRIHQEDAAQARALDLSARPAAKYETRGGPSLRAVADLLDTFGSQQDRLRLLALTTLNVVVGNADAHAKNLSLLHPDASTVTLAPAYDITPTTFYRGIPTPDGPKDLTDELGMFINGRRSIHKVTADDLITEGTRWGIFERQARATVLSTIKEIGDALSDAAHESGVPEQLVAFVAERAEALRRGRAAGTLEQTTSRSLDDDLPPQRRRASTSALEVAELVDTTDHAAPTPPSITAPAPTALGAPTSPGKVRCPHTNLDGTRCKIELLPGSTCRAHHWTAPSR